jgi:hypothetical protein
MEPNVQLAPHKVPGRTVAALWVLIAPTALIILTFTLYIVINLVFNPTMQLPADGEALAPTPMFITIINILLYAVGSISVVVWLPGLIVGMVLLSTRKRNAPATSLTTTEIRSNTAKIVAAILCFALPIPTAFFFGALSFLIAISAGDGQLNAQSEHVSETLGLISLIAFAAIIPAIIIGIVLLVTRRKTVYAQN